MRIESEVHETQDTPDRHLECRRSTATAFDTRVAPYRANIFANYLRNYTTESTDRLASLRPRTEPTGRRNRRRSVPRLTRRSRCRACRTAQEGHGSVS